ncbi:MAG TPA: hypothetical protein VH394_02945 [Thermoanaerobaculia bacterium]|jgi:hypothetical protein|nr:hypothetical protein [Thermoanaerobaculia bacterium]
MPPSNGLKLSLRADLVPISLVGTIQFLWRRGPYSATLNARLKNGIAYSSRCLGTGDTGEMPWTICVITASRDHAALKPLRDSLALGSCKESQ